MKRWGAVVLYRCSCGLSGLVLRPKSVNDFRTAIPSCTADFTLRQVDILAIDEQRREQLPVAIQPVDLHSEHFLDQPIKNGIDFWNIGLTRKFAVFHGLWGVDVQQPDAELGVVGGDDDDRIAVGAILSDVFIGGLWYLSYEKKEAGTEAGVRCER